MRDYTKFNGGNSAKYFQDGSTSEGNGFLMKFL